MKQFIYTFLFLTIGTVMYSQGTISGKVVDAESNQSLIGASVDIPGADIGTITDFEGNFVLENVPNGTHQLRISYIGYNEITRSVTVDNDLVSLGSVGLKANSVGLSEVVISGVIDLVRDRETPVAVSTIDAEEIQLKLGNQEFPEIMKTTPSVYTTKTGGGYGDGRISVRGFDNTNVAVIINGQPVNDMENGAVYWSNWAGLQDMASGIEIQRGLGASNLAVPSVGGTINVITKSSLSREGGYILGTVGNDNYIKTTVGYNTGVQEDGWSASTMVGRWSGDNYIDGGKGEGYNYLFGLGYTFNEKNSVNASLIGAGQWHHQRDAWISIRDYQNFGDDKKDGIDRRLNLDWGTREGEEYSYRRNFYNKPIASINWDWNIKDNMRLYTTVYGSWGRGGGTGPRGQNFSITPFREDLTAALADNGVDSRYRNVDGDASIDFQEVIENNRSGSEYTGDIEQFQGTIIGSNGYSENGVNTDISIRRSSINSHNWYGGISNFEVDVDKFTFGVGVDARSYRGLHYRVLNDLLGLDGYFSGGSGSNGNQFTRGQIITATSKASPFNNLSESPKIDYYNIGEVNWLGVNGLAEYKSDKFSAVIQGGISNQYYTRIDYFDQLPHESDQHTMTGGYVKGGANYNITDKHNVFFNAGFIARQPFFDAVFPNFANNINEDVQNEEITSFEIGYGFRSRYFRANLNGYYTTWANRIESRGVVLENGAEGTAIFSGIQNNHIGLELELTSNPIEKLELRAMASVGDWVYADNITAGVFDDNQQRIDQATLFIQDVKVGDVAQTTFNIGASYAIINGLSVDLSYLYYDNLYADFSIIDDEFLTENNQGALQLPGYGLLDAGLTYELPFNNGTGFVFRLNMNNVLDNVYIAESNSNIHEVGEGFSEYDGISNENSVWFGFGRTWNVSARYNF